MEKNEWSVGNDLANNVKVFRVDIVHHLILTILKILF